MENMADLRFFAVHKTISEFKRIGRIRWKYLSAYVKRILPHSPNTPRDIKLILSEFFTKIKNVLDHMDWLSKRPSHAIVLLKGPWPDWIGKRHGSLDRPWLVPIWTAKCLWNFWYLICTGTSVTVCKGATSLAGATGCSWSPGLVRSSIDTSFGDHTIMVEWKGVAPPMDKALWQGLVHLSFH
jgi:hypothetical protein